MLINKKELIKSLEALRPGLSSQEYIYQSNTFCFHDGYVFTYNDSISLKVQTDLIFTGSVLAKEFLTFLKKCKTNEGIIDIEFQNDQLFVQGDKTSKAWINVNPDIEIPVIEEPDPEFFENVPDNFTIAVGLALFNIDPNNSSLFNCVAIKENLVQSTDKHRVFTYDLSSDMFNSFLIQANVAKQLIKYKLFKYCLSEKWVHFKCDGGVLFSCRIFTQSFPDFTQIFESGGRNIALPSEEMIETLKRSDSFWGDGEYQEEKVTIKIEPSLMTIRSSASFGKFTEEIPMKNKDNTFTFEINPKFLIDVLHLTNKCKVNLEKNILIFRGEFWQHVISLSE